MRLYRLPASIFSARTNMLGLQEVAGRREVCPVLLPIFFGGDTITEMCTLVETKRALRTVTRAPSSFTKFNTPCDQAKTLSNEIQHKQAKRRTSTPLTSILLPY